MKALVYHGPARKSLERRPLPTLQQPTDAVVRMLKTTICGTDLHILKGDVPTCAPGRILGHEGVGVVTQTGSGVTAVKPGDTVLISCITACGKCASCRKGMYSHCADGGWILGHTIDGTQAEYVRIPHADTSLYKIPAGLDLDAVVMLSDIFPTGYECGVLNGKVKPGDTVAIVGAGPIGLATLLTAQFYTPAHIVMIDVNDNRLAVASLLGATSTVNSRTEDPVAAVMQLTAGAGVDAAIEAVGIPATFVLCEDLVAAGGVIANVGVHGAKADLHLEDSGAATSRSRRASSTVTTPLLLKTLQARKIDPTLLITHRYPLDAILQAYATFEKAADTRALKVLIDAADPE